VTTAEYAQKHGLHIETVRRRIKKNKIKAELQPDNTYIIMEEDQFPSQTPEQTTPNNSTQHHKSQQEPTTTHTTPDNNTQQQTISNNSTQQLMEQTDEQIQELINKLGFTESNLSKLTDDMVEERKRTDTIIMTQTQTIERQSERLDNLRLQLEETQRPRPLLDRLKAVFIPSNT